VRAPAGEIANLVTLAATGVAVDTVAPEIRAREAAIAGTT
jgi:hypothetical protein